MKNGEGTGDVSIERDVREKCSEKNIPTMPTRKNTIDAMVIDICLGDRVSETVGD